MFSLFFALFVLINTDLANASPIASCAAQANALSVTHSSCSSSRERTVCLTWTDGVNSVKSTSDTVSHACPVHYTLNNILNVKTEGWASDTPICVNVYGGNNAVFGVKDGSTCSLPGDYSIVSGDVGTCAGPHKVCNGNNAKECSWSFPTEVCPTENPTATPTEILLLTLPPILLLTLLQILLQLLLGLAWET